MTNTSFAIFWQYITWKKLGNEFNEYWQNYLDDKKLKKVLSNKMAF